MNPNFCQERSLLQLQTEFGAILYTAVEGYSHNVVISPQDAVIMEVNCGVEPKMEALLPAYASAAVCIYIGLNNVRLAISNP